MRTYESLRGSRLETVRENSRPPFAALQALRGRIADPLFPLPLKIFGSVGRQERSGRKEKEGARERRQVAFDFGRIKHKSFPFYSYPIPVV